MTVVRAAMQKGYCWIDPNTDAELLQKMSEILTFEVEGAEHTFAMQRGKWDGKTRLMDWRTKRFKIGLTPYVEKSLGITFEICKDERTKIDLDYVPIKVAGKYELRDIQKDAIKKSLRMMKQGYGSMHRIATNGGKTAIIAGIAKAAQALDYTFMIIERGQELAQQVRGELTAAGVQDLGQWGGGVKQLRSSNVVMVQTISGMIRKELRDADKLTATDRKVLAALRKTDIVLVDECHHALATTDQQLRWYPQKAIAVGFSGTIDDEKTLRGAELMASFGPIVSNVRNAELIRRGISAQPEITVVEYAIPELERKVASYKKKIKNACFKMIPTGNLDENGKMEYRWGFSVPVYTAYLKKFVMNYGVRHSLKFKELLVEIVKKHNNQPTVIMVDWIDFANELGTWLNAEVLHSKAKDRKGIHRRFDQGESKRLICTSILDEGISINRIKTLILATVGKSSRQTLQRLGRGLRKKQDENKLYLYDFIRWGHKYLQEPSLQRMRIWRDEGFDLTYVDKI